MFNAHVDSYDLAAMNAAHADECFALVKSTFINRAIKNVFIANAPGASITATFIFDHADADLTIDLLEWALNNLVRDGVLYRETIDGKFHYELSN